MSVKMSALDDYREFTVAKLNEFLSVGCFEERQKFLALMASEIFIEDGRRDGVFNRGIIINMHIHPDGVQNIVKMMLALKVNVRVVYSVAEAEAFSKLEDIILLINPNPILAEDNRELVPDLSRTIPNAFTVVLSSVEGYLRFGGTLYKHMALVNAEMENSLDGVHGIWDKMDWGISPTAQRYREIVYRAGLCLKAWGINMDMDSLFRALKD